MTISFACVAAMLKNSLTRKLSGAQRQVAARKGYELTDHSLVLYGICGDCRKKEQKTTRSDEIGSLTLFSKGLSSGIAKLPAASSEQG